MKKVLIVVGGTGGHIYPGIALAQNLAERNKDISFSFVTDKRQLALNILKEKGYVVHSITSAPLPRKKFWHTCRFILKMAIGIAESIILLRKNRPTVIVAFGAYISVPVAIAAKILKITVILHEQNYFPGLANKFLTFIAKKVAVSYTASREYFPYHKTILTGNPIRKELFEVSAEEGLKYFKLEKNKINILVFGGSLGSQSINLSILGILPYLEGINNDIQFVHISGKKDFQRIIDEYSKFSYTARVYEYIEKMEYAYSIADIIIARAGATTIAEISALGIPSILIPYPAATSQHQFLNTKQLCNAGCAICYDEEILSGAGLAVRLAPLIKDSNRRREMSLKAKIFENAFINASNRLSAVIEDYL